jgi:hypothetical protein
VRLPVLVFLLLSSQCLAQIDLSFLPAKSLVGATSPRVVGDRILIGEDSNPQVSSVAIIKVKSSEAFRIKARKSLFEESELVPLSDNEYLLIGEGEYLVEANSLNHERSLKVIVGSSPQPTPTPTPKPDPPKPDVTVPNEYNVGLIAYSKAPSDAAMARQIAGYYRINAGKLFGQGGLADIQSVLNQITKEFDSKQCRDQATCQKWAEWKVAVSKALNAEQDKRKIFSRQDWYSALLEVAQALESVK